jgi:hypothetical protein
MSDNAACFPEPIVDDPTPGRDREHRAAWLDRSTWGRAVEMRRFYNENLSALPPTIRDRLCRELKRDRTLAKHFELVVGRYLQLLGAQIDYEVPSPSGRRVDWVGHFPDGTVRVEATVPIANAVIGNTLAASARLVELAVRSAPRGWWVMVHAVPRFSANESLRSLRALLLERYATVPAPVLEARHEIEIDLDDRGDLRLALIARSPASEPAAYGGGPAVGFADDTHVVIQRAIDGKRRQVRDAPKPVLIALCTNGFGTHEVEKFDRALLGPTGSFRPDPPGKEPTVAGALVFANLEMRGGPDPILYRHPRYQGPFPQALEGLRQRTATSDDVEDRPATREGTLAGLGWPDKDAE